MSSKMNRYRIFTIYGYHEETVYSLNEAVTKMRNLTRNRFSIPTTIKRILEGKATLGYTVEVGFRRSVDEKYVVTVESDTLLSLYKPIYVYDIMDETIEYFNNYDEISRHYNLTQEECAEELCVSQHNGLFARSYKDNTLFERMKVAKSKNFFIKLVDSVAKVRRVYFDVKDASMDTGIPEVTVKMSRHKPLTSKCITYVRSKEFNSLIGTTHNVARRVQKLYVYDILGKYLFTRPNDEAVKAELLKKYNVSLSKASIMTNKTANRLISDVKDYRSVRGFIILTSKQELPVYVKPAIDTLILVSFVSGAKECTIDTLENLKYIDNRKRESAKKYRNSYLSLLISPSELLSFNRALNGSNKRTTTDVYLVKTITGGNLGIYFTLQGIRDRLDISVQTSKRIGGPRGFYTLETVEWFSTYDYNG